MRAAPPSTRARGRRRRRSRRSLKGVDAMRTRSIALIAIGCGLVLLGLPTRAQQNAQQPAPQQEGGLNIAYTGPPPISKEVKNFVPVTADMLLHPKPDNWISWRNGYSLWGYSSL